MRMSAKWQRAERDWCSVSEPSSSCWRSAGPLSAASSRFSSPLMILAISAALCTTSSLTCASLATLSPNDRGATPRTSEYMNTTSASSSALALAVEAAPVSPSPSITMASHLFSSSSSPSVSCGRRCSDMNDM